MSTAILIILTIISTTSIIACVVVMFFVTYSVREIENYQLNLKFLEKLYIENNTELILKNKNFNERLNSIEDRLNM